MSQILDPQNLEIKLKFKNHHFFTPTTLLLTSLSQIKLKRIYKKKRKLRQVISLDFLQHYSDNSKQMYIIAKTKIIIPPIIIEP